MSSSRVKIGSLIPIRSNCVTNESVPNIPIFEGNNIIGRNNLNISDKRVSRKHINLHASPNGPIEVHVEGPNPIIVRSDDQRKKLNSNEKSTIKDGEIMELIPGNYLYKYVAFNDSKNQKEIKLLKNEKRERQSDAEKQDFVAKRNKQVIEDEAYARDLQKKEDSSGLEPSRNTEQIREFKVNRDKIPLTFRLMQVQGLPSWANTSSVKIQDVVQGDVLVAILSNYMVDLDWLLSDCPNLRKVPHVLVVHGETSASLDHLLKSKPAKWVLHRPPLPISYGTHHSKAMILVYPKGVRIIVHTANLIYVDWNNKTQGLWMQDFPYKDNHTSNNSSSNNNKPSPFENDLVDYLSALKWPELRANLPMIGDVTINASFFKKFDYSSAKVRLIGSVPGYHNGPNLKKWGHMRLKSILEDSRFSDEFHKSPLIYQFSSLGSLDEKWTKELTTSMSAGVSDSGSQLGIGEPLIIWPTVEDVRCSLEGYAAGSAIPSPQKNVEKDFLKKYWAKWKANHVGRCRAMPHIKTYTRYNGQSIAWFLLTSANLSKAAWGALQKNNTQLMIRSYELGVLFLPSKVQNTPNFSCTGNSSPDPCESKPVGPTDKLMTKLVTLCWTGEKDKTGTLSEIVRLPVPYHMPPQPYTSQDVPWSWDRRYTKRDVYGKTWPLHV